MSKSLDRFALDVLACLDDLNERLPALTERFTEMVVVSAFAQHVGSALHLLMRRRKWDAATALKLLRRIESSALGSASSALGSAPVAAEPSPDPTRPH